MLRHGWPSMEDFCRDIIFYVATELAKVRRNYVGNGGNISFLLRQDFPCRDRGYLDEGIFRSRHRLLSRDKELA